MKTTHKALVLFASLTVLLTGCVAGNPNTSTEPTNNQPSSTSEPTIEPQHVVQIHITGDGFNLLYEPQEIAETISSETDVNIVLTKLEEVFGEEGTVTNIPTDNVCIPQSTLVTWGQFTIRYKDNELNHFQVIVSNNTVTEVNPNIKFTAYENTQLGDSYENVFSKLDLTEDEYFSYTDDSGNTIQWLLLESSTIMVPDPQYEEYYNPYGAIGAFENGKLTTIMTPTYLFDDC